LEALLPFDALLPLLCEAALPFPLLLPFPLPFDDEELLLDAALTLPLEELLPFDAALPWLWDAALPFPLLLPLEALLPPLCEAALPFDALFPLLLPLLFPWLSASAVPPSASAIGKLSRTAASVTATGWRRCEQFEVIVVMRGLPSG
jgi:hypothetical protein